MPGDHSLDRELPRFDALHHLERLACDLALVTIPVAPVGDEEGRLAGIAVGRLDDEIVSQPARSRQGDELRVRRRGADRVGDAGYARVVAEAGGLDLRVEPMAERGGRERHLEVELAGELFGLVVEHEERGLAGAVRRDEVGDLLVPEEVVDDLLDRPERARVCSRGTNTFGCHPSNES